MTLIRFYYIYVGALSASDEKLLAEWGSSLYYKSKMISDNSKWYFLIIGIWGSRERKIKAAFFFFLYTLLGSLVMLIGLLLILFEVGTTNLLILLTHKFSYDRQLLLWLLLFFSFAVKIPIIPVHIWLPEAHVEAECNLNLF